MRPKDPRLVALRSELRGQGNLIVETKTMRRRGKGELRDRIVALEMELDMMRRERDHERLMRVSAQRGLVRYMREHGLSDRIGYDPDQDPAVSEWMAELEAIAIGVQPSVT